MVRGGIGGRKQGGELLEGARGTRYISSFFPSGTTHNFDRVSRHLRLLNWFDACGGGWVLRGPPTGGSEESHPHIPPADPAGVGIG